jgi:hypothetical protein
MHCAEYLLFIENFWRINRIFFSVIMGEITATFNDHLLWQAWLLEMYFRCVVLMWDWKTSHQWIYKIQLAYPNPCASTSCWSLRSAVVKLAWCDPATSDKFCTEIGLFSMSRIGLRGNKLSNIWTCSVCWPHASLFKHHFPHEELNFITAPINIPAKSMPGW